MSNYNNDQPITSEIADKLNRVEFSKSIAELLILDANEPCLTVSLEGQWGQGKTSILNMVQEVFEPMDPSPIVVKYNAWINGKPESLIQDFLIQFTSQLNLTSNSEEGSRIAKELLSYSKLFSVAKLIPGIEPWGTLVENTLKSVGDAAESLSNLKELNVEDKKKQVEKQLQKIDKPIVVIIDDIDRLTPQECFQVLRLVKAVADFPRTAFILLFEPNYLQSVLAYNNIDNTNEYIDKIVQLRIPVPNITTKDLDELIDDCFEKMGEQLSLDYYQDDRDRLTYIYARHLQKIIHTPRDVKRIFNNFKFIHSLVKNQVCVTDLFILSVIATKAHKIYNHIKSHPVLYAQKGNSDSFHCNSLNKKEASILCRQQRNAIYKTLSLPENNNYEELLSEIFPSMNEKHIAIYAVQDPDAAGRIDDINRLSTALHISTPKTGVSDQYVIDFIKSFGKKSNLIDDAVSNGAIKRFLELFEINLDKTQPSTNEKISLIQVIVKSLLSKNQLNGYRNLYSGVFSEQGLYDKICQLLNRVLRESKYKDFVMNSIIDDIILIPFAANLLSRLKNQHNKQSDEDPWFSEEKVDILIKKYALKAKKVLLNGSLNSKAMEYHVISLLWSYDKEMALNIMKGINQNDVLTVGWLLIGRIGSDSSNGNYLSVNLDEVRDIYDINHINKLKKGAKELLKTKNLPPEDIAIAHSLIDENSYYLKGGIAPRW